METHGLIFDLEWKKRDSIVGRNEDVASIGIWDTSETSLNLLRFKSYLSQSLGTPEDISFAFVDSDGDEIEIDNEYDFVQALKFARKRALKGQRITLRVEKLLNDDSSITSSTTEVSLQAVAAKLTMIGQDCRKEKSQKQGANSDSSLKVKSNPKSTSSVDEHSESNPPLWFKKYMQKLKSDLVAEVTAQVVIGIQNICDQNKEDRCNCFHKPVFNEESRTGACEDESSDGDVKTEIRDSKLLRKIEKLQKREKKLEKRLDSKIEKLENKTRKMLEKKSQTKPRARAPEKMPSRKVPHMSVATFLMDAVLVGDCEKPDKHVKCGERFTKTWEVLNCGTLPWTDKTDLRLTWGSDGLIPDERIVRCPILEPGETGKITVNFKAPDVPGNFESYWHFYHMGERFGHWIHCNIISDQKSKENNGSSNLKDTVKNYLLEDLTKYSSDENYEGFNITKPLDAVKSDAINQQARGPEYDSDSDNISIISATASQSSDSEMEINEFVMVPGLPEQIPTSIQQTCLEAKVKPTETNSSMQTSERFSSNSLSKQSSSCSINGSKTSNKVIDNENNNPPADVADSALNATFSKVTVQEESQAEENECNKPFSCNEKLHRQQSHSSDSSIQSLHSSPTRTDHFDRIKFHGGAKKVIYAVNKNGCSIPVEVLQSKHDGSTTSVTEPSNSSPENSESTTRNSSRQFSNSHHNPNVQSNDIIHILPETLVNGAVNVATSALSRAKAVISNLTIPIPEARLEVSESLSSEMKQLIEMGFYNKRLNEVLLNRYDNDVTKVVAELVSLEVF